MHINLVTISQFGLNHLLGYADGLRLDLEPYIDAVTLPLTLFAVIILVFNLGYSISSNYLSRELQDYMRPLLRPILIIICLQLYQPLVYYTLVVPGESLYKIALDGYDKMRADNIFSSNGYSLPVNEFVNGIPVELLDRYKNLRNDVIDAKYGITVRAALVDQCRQQFCQDN